MSDIFYTIGGIALILLGTWLSINEIKIFIKGKQGELGYDVKGFGLGIIFIIFGILIITNR